MYFLESSNIQNLVRKTEEIQDPNSSEETERLNI